MTKDLDRRIKLVAAVMGCLIAFLVLAIAGYELSALNTLSRTFVGVDIWLVVFFALALSSPLRTRWVRWVAGVSVAVILLVFAVSSVVRTNLWSRLWDVEQTVLESIPSEWETTGPEAVIVFCGWPTVDGFPPFPYDWAMYNAFVNRPTGSPVPRQFYPAGRGTAVEWDGERLIAGGNPAIGAREVWVWQWPDRFEQITSPRAIIDSEGRFIDSEGN